MSAKRSTTLPRGGPVVTPAKKTQRCVCSTVNCEQCFPRRTHRAPLLPGIGSLDLVSEGLPVVRRTRTPSPISHGVSHMKRIFFTLVIACFAMSGTAQADIWGRVNPNSLIAQTQNKAETVPSPAVDGPAVQAPAGPTQFDGYPFADRCGGSGLGCCANVWAGYSKSCGCGSGRGMLAHSGKHCGCGRLHGHGNGSNCCGGGSFGGCVNSFAGGACCGGGAGGFGGHFGGKHLHALRHACGFGCNSNCDNGGKSTGCSGCKGQDQQHDGAKQKLMNPPSVIPEITPVPEQDSVPPAPSNEKTTFRSWYPSARQFSSGF